MGKSPGKWIKTVLFGKKHSKTNFSKNITPDKRTAGKTAVEDLSQNAPVISDPYQSSDRGVDTLELEKESSGFDAIASSPLIHDLDSKSENGSTPVNDADIKSRDLAASKVQAAFRGYLARRAFRALKGIIRLQALIRGHLVRRQAVATLRCMKAIVQFQALVRGRKLKIGPNSVFGSEKLATNTFVRKLLFKMPASMPLSLQYDVSEPNSAWNWLERWSVIRFWDPPARAKKMTKSKAQRKQPSPHIFEPETGKSKRTIRNGTSASETDNKPRRNPGKFTNNPTELAQEQAQSELERVKRNLRKVSSSTASAQAPEKSELEAEKPQGVETAKTPSPFDVPDLEIANPPENNPVDPEAVAEKPHFVETHVKNEPVNAPYDPHPVTDAQSVENDVKIESTLNLDDELTVMKEKGNNKDSQKIKKRRSLPAKQEVPEKISQNNSPSLPSYMAATESAKARLRGQGSTKFGEDGDESGNTNGRRHSLPASSNGKLGTLSPRLQKPVQANGKGNSKINAALASSKDDKVVQPGWRR